MLRLTNYLAAIACLVLASLHVVYADNSAGCGKSPTLKNQSYNMQVNGKQRQYFIKLPDNYDSSHPYRLVFTWHPLGGSAQGIVNGANPSNGGILPYYGLSALANNSAIFVVPNGLNAGWGNQGGEDITFFDQLVKTVEADLCVNTNLRFSTGFSYGGAMSYALACGRPNMIRAVAVLSGGLLSGCQGGTGSVAYYGQHGTRDSVLNVSGGRQMRDKFVSNNGCQKLSSEPQPNGGTSVMTKYTGCKEGYPVTWVIHDGDHNPSQVNQGSSTPFAPQNSWDFFTQFS
ncbi:alpha/beta-hydrolase [Xylaria bambusicola]|uniref:alpha/beta-hydrolase n=1 Tax=Xylaria bambusicola TaxID=326684 RepID=UPI002008E0B9|nr:alpha/beta-hydrolase [Xylaria bambusicola]KAI0518137.1 alpha/beta-hydrolase [Xylaria bambusicola]